MKRKMFCPELQSLLGMTEFSGGELLMDPSNEPPLGVLHLRSVHGKVATASWDFADVEFRFEVYFVRVESAENLDVSALNSLSKVPVLGILEYLFRAEWLRPAAPGEVPEHFEQVIEGRGSLANVPASATAVGIAFAGVVFRSEASDECVGLCIDDVNNYSLRIVNGVQVDDELLAGFDRVPLSELKAWLEKWSYHGPSDDRAQAS
ncbi:MAG: hypothetical protein KA505_08700 [Xanthomonadales bacterium]|nr:hypothetical protein [Xanthomonadales bacterium]MBP6078873.1 hypothetical protein [Xanthomonadales bacterium]MBP7622509.1 hypothetical protein [Xanthomonadales bacterium]